MKWGRLVELKKLRVKSKLKSLTAAQELRLLNLEQEKLDLEDLVPVHWDIKKLKKLRKASTPKEYNKILINRSKK